MTAKADRIEKLVGDPDLKEAFKVVREGLRDMIEDTPLATPEALLNIRTMLFLLQQVEAALQTAIEDGHLEDFNVEEQERNVEEISRWR